MALPEKTFEATADTGNVRLAQVKANQPSLLDTVKTLGASTPPTDRIETVDRHHHGRQEHRTVEVTFSVCQASLTALHFAAAIRMQDNK